MSTEVWLRNPHNYHRQIREVGHVNTVWNWTTLRQKRADPVSFSEMAFGGLAWRTMVVGGYGCALYRPGDSRSKPSAVFPFWSATHSSMGELHKLIKNPVGNYSFSDELLGTLRPVLGQEHRIVIGYLPTLNTKPGQNLMVELGQIQRDNPQVILHHFGASVYASQMGVELGSLDFDAREYAAYGQIVLPVGGKYIPDELPPERYQYIEMLEYNLRKLYDDPAYRCKYNIEAAVWAGKYYVEEMNYVVRRKRRKKNSAPETVPLSISDKEASKVKYQPQTKSVFIRPVKRNPGDTLSCNHCRMQFACKAYREGSVCTLPDTPGRKLADMFKVRDANSVIDGLSHLLVMQANRLQDAMTDEEQTGEGLNPEVSKEIKATFENGKTLAQLLDPGLKGGPKVVNNNNTGPSNTLVVAQANPNELVAGIVRQLEQQGIPRESITQDMISNAMAALSQNKVIEA